MKKVDRKGAFKELEGCSRDFDDEAEEVSWLSQPSQSEEQRWTGCEEKGEEKGEESFDEDQQSEEELYCGRSMESSGWSTFLLF